MIPPQIYIGDTVEWIDSEVPDGATAVSYYFRTNTEGAAATATGTVDEDVWTILLPSTTTELMVEGDWGWQAVATLPSGQATYATGRITVNSSFIFSGHAHAVDLRTQAEKDLDAVEEAIRVLASGAQSYTIGTATGGRTFTRVNLNNLVAWRDRLVNKVSAERIASGQTRRDRRILVSFD